jgi:uncharacterized protein YecE (DUF72 family)
MGPTMTSSTLGEGTRAHVGASGFSYPSWRPGFYPAGTRPQDFLRLYAERLPAVELNTTGYRLPAEAQFEHWAEQTPPRFRFAVKMQPWTLRNVDVFEQRVRRLGERLGPIRVAVKTARDDGFLELALGSIDPGLRYAFDLPDPSWDGVEERLAEAGAVRVGALEGTAAFRYLRFREPPYDEADLAAHAETIRPLLARGVEVYAFYRHEDAPTAPAYALRLLELVR